jgi:hypothetical protein
LGLNLCRLHLRVLQITCSCSLSRSQEWANVNSIQLANGGNKATTTFKAEEEQRNILQVRAMLRAAAFSPCTASFASPGLGGARSSSSTSNSAWRHLTAAALAT